MNREDRLSTPAETRVARGHRPLVAIVGRPNVGKSTLFNRLVGKHLAIVEDEPGVTRDRRMGDATISGLEFTAVDTAGWEDEDAESLPGRMRAQTEIAVRDADVVLFMIDALAWTVGGFITAAINIMVGVQLPLSFT